MKLIELKCPNCGAPTQVDMSRAFCFCQYCGTKMLIDKETIHIKDTKHIIDEAKIREAEALERIKTTEAFVELEKERQKAEAENKLTKMILISVMVCIILSIFCMLMATL